MALLLAAAVPALRAPQSERDAAGRDTFDISLTEEVRDGIRWRFRSSERDAVTRWEPVLLRFRGRDPAGPILVVLYPDPATKGRYTGSSRPADFSGKYGVVRVELDASAPREPDLITPALAAAAYAARDNRLLARPMLLAALGARAAGRWWGRPVATWGAFARKARVEPTPAQVASSDPDVSPVLGIGAAAAWIESGVADSGEFSVQETIAGLTAPLEAALARWADRAAARDVAPPVRRGLPPRFLRGISYAMSNSVDASYSSPRSRETLSRLAQMAVDSISIMPFAFQRDPHVPVIRFIHRSPGGETDEGTVRAVSDGRALGMTAMVKPQLWVAGERFVGEIAMGSEEAWRHFFDAYRRFLVHHAVVAEAAGAGLFCVGTEHVGTEARQKDWRETIAAARLATGAPLLYAANWAAGAPRVPFWDALDAIGVDFYDPLSKDLEASDAALEAGVLAAVAPLEKLARAAGRQVIFAEAGFPGVKAAWVAPHDESSGRPSSPDDAGRAIAAVFHALAGKPWWKGVYWWKAFSSGQSARVNERGYNLLGAPAERVIREGFLRIGREAGRS